MYITGNKIKNSQYPVVGSGLDFVISQTQSYKGLYGGLDAKGLHKKVRRIMRELGGTIPEDLPTQAKSAKQPEKKLWGQSDK